MATVPVSTVKAVRADPGGLVRLGFTADGWTVERETGWHPEPPQVLGLGILGCGVLAWLAEVLGQRWLTIALGVVAGLLLLGIIVLALAEVVGAAWLAGSALTRGGRRRIRREARDFWSALAPAGPITIPATRVRSAERTRSGVVLTLDDGSTQRYSTRRRRNQLAAAFGRLLGPRLR